MVIAACILLCCLFSVFSVEYWPNDTDVQRAIEFQRLPIGWGFQARQERSLRVFAIGGSNTRNELYPDPIIKGFKSISESWTASFHRLGVGGIQPFDIVGRKFDFETWVPSLWPNVIMLELSANIEAWHRELVDEGLDSIIAVIRKKYTLTGLSSPDIMFLELFNVRPIILYMNAHPNATVEEKIEQLNVNPDCRTCNVSLPGNYCKLREFAEYFGIPTVSWRELAFNTFVRYFLETNVSFTTVGWHLTNDGIHISAHGGIVLYDKLLKPFFRQVMAPRIESMRPSTNYTLGVRMFPPKNWSMELLNHAAKRNSHHADIGVNVSDLVRRPTQWSLSTIHHGEEHLCSWTESASFTLDINMPKECDVVETCHISLGFLHSWNTSHTGHLVCKLYSHTLVMESMFVNTTINAEGLPMQNTFTVKSEMKSQMKAGNYSVSCTKLDSKMSCLTSFAACSIMEI